MKGVLALGVAEVAIVTYRAVHQDNPTAIAKETKDNRYLTVGGFTGPSIWPIPHVPVPSTYVNVAVVFAALTLLPDAIGTTVGAGLVVATLLNLWQPNGKLTSSFHPPTKIGAGK